MSATHPDPANLVSRASAIAAAPWAFASADIADLILELLVKSDMAPLDAYSVLRHPYLYSDAEVETAWKAMDAALETHMAGPAAHIYGRVQRGWAWFWFTVAMVLALMVTRPF